MSGGDVARGENDDPLEFCGTCDLSTGDRIRHRVHTELTGYVKAIEWARPGKVSGIPYLVGWDDSGRAHDLLGMLFVYSSDHSIERDPASG